MTGSKHRYTIEFGGYSMFPVLRPGDRLIVQSVPAEAAQVGDILINRRNGHPPAAHRFVKRLSATTGLTKGDAMLPQNSEPVTLTGTVERVEAVIRAKKIISLSTGLRGATKRWRAFFSRHGWTSGAVRQRIRTSLPRRPSDRRPPTPTRSEISVWLSGPQDRRIDPQQIKCRMPILLAEGMAGVAYRRFRNRPTETGVRQRLEDAYHATVKQNLIHLHFIQRLEDHLSSTAIEAMVVKGGALLHHIYPHVGMRPMEDVDLLVRPAHHRQLVQRLIEMGFRQNPLRTYSFTNHRMRLDLHSDVLNTDRIASRIRLFPAGMEPIWRRAVPWDDGYRRVQRPDDTDHLLILCQHLLKHYFCRLIWLEDIRRLLDGRDETFFMRLRARAVELGQEKPLAYCLYLLRSMLGFSLPESSPLQVFESRLGSIEHFLLRLALTDRNVELLAPALSAGCIEGFRQRLDFLRESLFLREEVLAAEFGSQQPGGVVGRGATRILRAVEMLLRHLVIIAKARRSLRFAPPPDRNR